MEELKTLAKGYFWESLFYGLSKIVSFVYSIMIAYFFLKDDIGLFYFSLSVIYIFSAIRDFGLAASLNRNIPYLLGKKNYLDLFKNFRVSFSLGIFFAFIVFLFLYNFSPTISKMLNNSSAIEYIKIMALLILLFEVFELSKFSLFGFLDFKKATFLDFFQSLIKLIATYLLYSFFGNSIFVLIYGFIISYIPSSVIGLYFIIKKIEFIKNQATNLNQVQNQLRIYDLIAFGFTLTIVNSLFVVQQSIDKLMLGYFTPNEYSFIGIYTIMQTLSSAVVLLPSLIASVSLPIMASLYGEKKEEKLKEFIQNSFGWLLIILLPSISFLIVFSDVIIQIFYGRSFLLGNNAFIILVIANAIYISSSIFSQYLISTRRLFDELKFASINVTSNVIGNAILIPIFGIVGAAFGTLVSSTSMFIAMYLYAVKHIKFTFEERYLKMIVIAILTTLMLIALNDLFFDLIVLNIDSITSLIGNLPLIISIILTRFVKMFVLLLILILSYFIFLLLGHFFKIYNQNDIKIFNQISNKFFSLLSSLTKKNLDKKNNSKEIIFLGTGFHYAHTILIDGLKKHVPVNVVKYRPATFQDPFPIKVLNVIKGILFLPKADVYICESNFYYPVLNKLLFFWRKKPVVININASPIFYRYVKSKNFLLRNLFIFLVKQIDCQICVGKFYADILKEIGYKGHILVYYPPIREEIIKFAEEHIEKINKKNNRFITVVTNDWYVKGLDITLKIFDKISEKVNCELFVVGKFNIEKFPEFNVKRKNVSYTDQITLYELAKIYASSAIIFQPSRQDTFGLAALEGMLFGVIPIISKYSGVSEVVKELDQALIVDTSDLSKIVNLVINLVLDDKLREEYSRKSVDVVKNYQEKKTNLDQVVDNLLNYLKNVKEVSNQII